MCVARWLWQKQSHLSSAEEPLQNMQPWRASCTTGCSGSGIQLVDTKALHLVHGPTGIVVTTSLAAAFGAKNAVLRLTFTHESIEFLGLHNEGQIRLLMCQRLHGALK